MKINKILVALDLSNLDEQLIKYASYLSDMTGAEKVYFMHNIKKFEFSELFQQEIKDLNLNQLIEDKISKKINANYSAKDVNYEIILTDDAFTERKIADTAKELEVDLVMVGNKNTYKGTGAVSGKLLRILKCHVLSIPAQSSTPIKKILTTTDFSNKSLKGLNFSLEVAERSKSEVSCAHIYKIPAQYFPVLDVKSAKEKIEKHRNKSFDKLKVKIGTDSISPLIMAAGDHSVPEKIRKVAEEGKFDLVVISDKGHSNFASLFVGSTTEELFTHYLEVPLWVVK